MRLFHAPNAYIVTIHLSRNGNEDRDGRDSAHATAAAGILSYKDVCGHWGIPLLRHLQFLACVMCWLLRALDKSLLFTLNSIRSWLWLSCTFQSTQAAIMLEFMASLTNRFVHRWFCLVLGPKPLLHGQKDSVWANTKKQNAFLYPVHAMFHNECSLAAKPESMSWCLSFAFPSQLGEILYLLIWLFLLYLSWLLHFWVLNS